ncbi:hypothetical protein ARMGADRAFT_53259 [Armillaria gallica]|uniref:Uncharacterized protein n=1 Tax=Armillaria gallica TaxID=47427 RepID=A0A2H3EDV8_ARMGA|nr:hypothetical protein ARMGADRAFT_53259 [Armillaria gallica]
MCILGRCGTVPGAAIVVLLLNNERGTVGYLLSGHARMPKQLIINNSSLSHRLPRVLLSSIGSPFPSYFPALHNMNARLDQVVA